MNNKEKLNWVNLLVDMEVESFGTKRDEYYLNLRKLKAIRLDILNDIREENRIDSILDLCRTGK